MARILIAGCGDVGSLLGLSLARTGHDVWGLRRNAAAVPTPIRPLAADLSDSTTLEPLPANLGYVFYTAAAGGATQARYHAAYVEGVANLIAALQRAKQHPRRLIFTSSTSVYAQSDGAFVDEDSPADADGFSAQCLRQGEDQVWRSLYPGTVIRFGGIYGPGRTRLIDSLRQGESRCAAGAYTNRIHRDDCAGTLMHIMGLPNPAPLYLGVDDHPALQCEVLQWLAERLGVSGPTQMVTDNGTRRGGNKRCRNDHLRASGYQFRYPSYREGYAEMLKSS
jgi:nucleoside-diphosphate-sugar epimerase